MTEAEKPKESLEKRICSFDIVKEMGKDVEHSVSVIGNGLSSSTSYLFKNPPYAFLHTIKGLIHEQTMGYYIHTVIRNEIGLPLKEMGVVFLGD